MRGCCVPELEKSGILINEIGQSINETSIQSTKKDVQSSNRGLINETEQSINEKGCLIVRTGV
ncbi:hypothetical protein MM300_10310 [Evansella sp. LMS18]|uniref:hypothetical protein n=1 Tax=Evansella sp. LMS18 TaxID=2924033 RepID=UPI0020D1450F|nr:hypothetical protein [Evansella sp. LMS18]UTR12628.1 hypothetical protein MM300_10310 [Evansella sp. LMS18]